MQERKKQNSILQCGRISGIDKKKRTNPILEDQCFLFPKNYHKNFSYIGQGYDLEKEIGAHKKLF